MRLYPRLPTPYARSLFEARVDWRLDDLAEVAAFEHDQMIWAPTGAARVSESEMEDLRESVLTIVTGHGYPKSPSRSFVVEIDRDLARALSEAPGLTTAEAGRGDVWSFLSLVLLPDVVQWRAMGSTNVERFVGTDLTRHSLARLWWRAHLFTHGLEDSGTGWELWADTRIGEADLDQIQTRRGGFGQSPGPFRALIRVYPRVSALAADRDLDRRTLWREWFLARLLRFGAFVEFLSLSEDELVAFFEEVLGEGPEVVTPASPVSAANGAESEDGAPGPTPVEEGGTFDDVRLRDIVVGLAELVRAGDGVATSALASEFERLTGIEVPAGRIKILRGIAWQGTTLGYLEHDKETDLWTAGSTRPAPDRRWGNWSIKSLTEHVRNAGELSEGDLAASVFAGNARKTVKAVVSAALAEARRPEPVDP